MKLTWILVADSTRARIFTADTPSSPLEEIEDFSHTEGRLHDREITSDLPGKIKSAGAGGHTFEQPTDPKNTKPTFLRIASPNIWKTRTTQTVLTNC